MHASFPLFTCIGYPICISGNENDPTSAYKMCTNPYCLGTYWCSQWGCCEPPEDGMGDSDFEEPPIRKKTTPHLASPVSPSKMDTICQVYVPPNTKKGTSWAARAQFSSSEISRTRKAVRNALKITWRSPLQVTLTAGCRASW